MINTAICASTFVKFKYKRVPSDQSTRKINDMFQLGVTKKREASHIVNNYMCCTEHFSKETPAMSKIKEMCLKRIWIVDLELYHSIHYGSDY